MFVYPDRRAGKERRSGYERRQNTDPVYVGTERRRKVARAAERKVVQTETITPPPKQYYSTAEVAEATGLSQTTLLLWIRNKIIDGSRIKRSLEGRRLWTPEDIEEIRRIKNRNGWNF